MKKVELKISKVSATLLIHLVGSTQVELRNAYSQLMDFS